jgi:hypothetical protein
MTKMTRATMIPVSHGARDQGSCLEYGKGVIGPKGSWRDEVGPRLVGGSDGAGGGAFILVESSSIKSLDIY